MATHRMGVEGAMIHFAVESAAGRAAGAPNVLVELDAPVYLANKANVSNRARMRRGSIEWQRIQDFELAVKCAAREAVRGFHERNKAAWPRDARSYVLRLGIEFGDRVLVIPATPGRSRHERRDTGAARCKRTDIDAVKSILDALEGELFDDDNRVTRLIVEKQVRHDGLDGDRIVIACGAIGIPRSAGDRPDESKAERGAPPVAVNKSGRSSAVHGST